MAVAHGWVEVRLPDGRRRTLSVFDDAIVEHPWTEPVTRRWVRRPHPLGPLLILVLGLAVALSISQALALWSDPPFALVLVPPAILVPTVIVAMVRAQLYRMRNLEWRAAVTERRGRREVGRVWDFGVLMMFEAAPSGDEFTVWTPDEVEIPARDIAGLSVEQQSGSCVITVTRRDGSLLSWSSDPDAAAVIESAAGLRSLRDTGRLNAPRPGTE